MANGAKAVGRVFVREPGAVITDDVIAVESLDSNIDLEYLAVALRSAIASGGYVYEAKLFVRRVKALTIAVPVRPDGAPDLEQQRRIAAAVKRFDSIRERLSELGTRSSEARIR
jgi:type I restriction enzyme M protein